MGNEGHKFYWLLLTDAQHLKYLTDIKLGRLFKDMMPPIIITFASLLLSNTEACERRFQANYNYSVRSCLQTQL